MLLALPLVTILCSALAVTASIAHDAHNQVARHHKLARTPEPVPDTPTSKLRKRKSCKAPTSKSTAPKSSTKKKPTSTKKTEAAKATSNAKSNFAASGGSTSSSVKGVIKIQASRCGDNGASTKISNTKGPNGSLDWLNCGVEEGGWNPPFIGVDDVVATDLSEALKSPSSPFHACAPYLDIFYDAAGKYGLKPIMLAAFAMQESSCNKNTVGGGGEQGLMQITQEKCGGAPGGNCRDPWFNIHTGAKFFAKTLDDNNGNLLLSLGNYNGWYKGLTVAKATAARYTSCCRCQNNLDYLHQWMNGWILNQNAYALSLGRYHNLDVCGH